MSYETAYPSHISPNFDHRKAFLFDRGFPLAIHRANQGAETGY
ncbi:hypothetical protein [Flagellimonas sp.]